MIAIIKVLLTLTLIIVLLQRRAGMGNAMLAGSMALFLMSSPEMSTLMSTLQLTIMSTSTWNIVAAMYFVMCLEYQLRIGGIIDGLMAVARYLLKSNKVLLAIMPLFLGFLPSLGGAIFSAPLVESAGKEFNPSPEKKTIINYWFRHILEFANPIIPGLLLASEIANIPLGIFIANMLWATALCFVIGWIVCITPLKSTIEYTESIISNDQPKNKYRFLALSAGPIIANFILVVGLGVSPSISMFLVVVAMTIILKFKYAEILGMLTHAFDRNLLWGLVGVLFFQHMLKQTGLIDTIAALFNSINIPLEFILSAIAFTAGLLTGNSQGFVAITFPIIAALSPGNISMAVVCYVTGVAGQMLSPAHLCLLVTIEYFKADFVKTLRPIIFMETIMVIIALGITLL